jgi:hypothetical protein
MGSLIQLQIMQPIMDAAEACVRSTGALALCVLAVGDISAKEGVMYGCARQWESEWIAGILQGN